ncbi:MAG: ABC-F family ATP-binding cassette domain-containing protein [Desulfofustis sp.]|nr:ABC-F family ATP-binding cassette domain-containing protein [Desulfofustis sp.]
MSAIVSCRSVTKSFGAQLLFSELNLIIAEGDRVGLIGPNGSGKSTLLKIIAGRDEQDHGEVIRRRNLVVSYLAQEDELDGDLNGVDNLLQALAGLPLEPAERQSRAEAMLSRAQLPEPQLPVSRLSGGWRKRVAICCALVVEPDLLIMDEPTNHLDIAGIVWLEQVLASPGASSSSGLIMVSHDRRFLETSVNRIVELSRSYPSGTFQVDGSYSLFLEKRQEFLDQQAQQEERLANKVRRENEWLRRGPKARATKARYRVDEAYRLQDELARVKALNRAEGRVGIDFSETGRKTKKLLEARGLSKSVGGTLLFSGLDLVLSPGVRIGLVGPNGCGKSTVMQILSSAANGAFTADAGEIKVADGVQVATFTQDRSGIDRQATLRRALAPEGDGVIFRGRPVHVVSWAKRFLFRPDQLETPVEQLSGGEQARILIAELMRQPADILLLDEPTNDLDIASLDVLEEGLLDFDGALLLVTHDRYLLDRVCDSVLGFTGDGTVRRYGDYEQWLRDLDESGKEGGKAVSASPARKERGGGGSKKGARLTYREQQEYERIEGQIMAAEERLEYLEERLGDPGIGVDPEALRQCWEDHAAARQEVDALYRRWEELEQKRA